ncbi:hypothetical protein BDN71DRAFT_1437541 [Pleurotus eryngii]|uniref:Uncharacterized protein n=1 Tax=Pleurotus eryngii TaxID=5323 RepID=A0A9P6ABW2_PLEER|nr:hypothetical protein BDN71DRAFT_1437541 [Pleurotus eryngii]
MQFITFNASGGVETPHTGFAFLRTTYQCWAFHNCACWRLFADITDGYLIASSIHSTYGICTSWKTCSHEQSCDRRWIYKQGDIIQHSSFPSPITTLLTMQVTIVTAFVAALAVSVSAQSESTTATSPISSVSSRIESELSSATAANSASASSELSSALASQSASASGASSAASASLSSASSFLSSVAGAATSRVSAASSVLSSVAAGATSNAATNNKIEMGVDMIALGVTVMIGAAAGAMIL